MTRGLLSRLASRVMSGPVHHGRIGGAVRDDNGRVSRPAKLQCATERVQELASELSRASMYSYETVLSMLRQLKGRSYVVG